MTESSVDSLVERCASSSASIVVVTRTARLARALTLRVAESRARSGWLVGEMPAIRSLDAWLDELAEHVVPGRLLLSASTERALWEQIIASATADIGGELLDLPSLAAQAATAHERLSLWGEPDWHTEVLTQDGAAFCDWLFTFRRRLSDEKWVTRAQLPGLFTALLDSARPGDLDAALVPPALALVAFERTEPALEALAAALRRHGTEVETVGGDPGPAPAAATVRVLRGADTNAEIRGVAGDIHSRLLADPELRIGVLAPAIDEIRGTIDRIFEEELEAAALMDDAQDSARCYEVSVAPRLIDYPMIAHALDLLAVDGDALSFEAASRILLAPYPRPRSRADDDDDEPRDEESRWTEGEREFEARGAVEAALRRDGSAHPPLAGSSRSSLAARALRHGAPVFASRLEALRAHLQARPLTDSPGNWRRHFIAVLDAMGWPGRLSGEAEGVVFQRWRDAMAELAGLEVMTGSMTAGEALAQLRQICASISVQAGSEGPPVQVMDLLDAAGLRFDVVYVIGMTATAFPAAPRPNPFLPIHWQRRQGLPRASAEAERDFAEIVWRRVLASAPLVIASYPGADRSGEEKSASALLPATAEEETRPAREGLPWWVEAFALPEAAVPRLVDTATVPLMRRGGSTVLSDQSACPFKAFARVRLGAEPLGTIQIQPDPSTRGQLVHKALEVVYRRVRDSRALASLTDAQLAALAEAAADEALQARAVEAAFAGGSRVWLVELVTSWLRYEKDERSGDWRIDALETEIVARVPAGAENALELTCRLDRIDELDEPGESESGGALIIDFKTSVAAKDRRLWSGSPPEDPQLPLYAVLLADSGRAVAGIAFANLPSRDACAYSGIAAGDLADKLGPLDKYGFSGDWADDLASMRRQVEGLALSFLAGEAKVAPRKPAVCQYCGMQSLCRIFENPADEDEEQESA